MKTAISNYHIQGIQTTLAFGTFVCEHEAFQSGNFDTHFVKKYYAPEQLLQQQQTEAKVAALIAVKHYIDNQKQLKLPQ